MGDETKSRPSAQTEENKYKEGKAKESTTANLNIFKPKDVMKWSKNTRSDRNNRKVSSGGKVNFGGSRLGTKMRLHRKKNNRTSS